MKITFKAKIIYEDPGVDDEYAITFEKIKQLLLQDKDAKFKLELLIPWSNDAEPTLIIHFDPNNLLSVEDNSWKEKNLE